MSDDDAFSDDDLGDDIGDSGDEGRVSDSDGGDEPQAAHTRHDKPRGGGTPFGAGGAKFASAVAKLLGGPPGEGQAAELPVTTKRKRQAAGGEAGGDAAPGAPILSRSRSTVKRTEDERAERLRLKAARRHKRELKEAGHLKPSRRGEDPEADARERSLRIVATRGVVTLFNAVAKAQKARRDAQAAGDTKAASELAPRRFLTELRRAAGVAEQPQDGARPSGWAVLRDDYARGGPGATLKAWNRAGARDEVVIREQDDLDDGDEDDVEV